MGERLKGKVAVVTGAGRGIGRCIALALAAEGAKVVVNDLGGEVGGGAGSSSSPAEEVVAEIKCAGGEAVANFDTVTTPEGGENIIKTATERFGKIDVLVNNAGVLRDRMIWNMAPEEWDTVIKVHLYGTFNCTRPASALMREQRSGRIINMISTSGLFGNPGQANYSAAKGGILGFTRACTLALGRYGVTVNAVAPSAATRMTKSVPEERLRELMKTRFPGADVDALTIDEIYDQVLGRPEDVPPIIVFLATDAAADINGQVFFASDGRITIYAPVTEMRTIYKQGQWTQEELATIVPSVLAAGVVNPAPKQ